jgi:hypothetical protein
MGNLFSPKAAEPKPVATMPDPDGPAAQEARRRKQAEIMGRAGRSSTILSAPRNNPTGDFDSYDKKNLG